MRSATMSPTYGDARFSDVAKRTGPPGNGSRSWSTTSFPSLESFIPGRKRALPSKPKVGAECLNWACSDLCGGPSAMMVPTAIIISTSGTTGVPKGVADTHRATMNRLEWMYQTFPFSPNEVCCHKTALSFVDSIWEVFGPLLREIPNVIVSEDVVIEPERLIALFARYRVTRIVLVPTLLNVLLECFPDLSARIPDLKLWTVSGEYLPIALAKKFRAALPEATLLSLYGSSEVAGDATFYVVGEHNPTRDVVPIGKPLSNTQVYVLDANREPVPIGVPGTLHVGGDCLAQGYWLRPDLTGERFIPNPFCAKYGLIFDTGDRAKWLADGNLEFLGPIDTQIKNSRSPN